MLSPKELDAIVDRVVQKLAPALDAPRERPAPAKAPAFVRGHAGVFDDLDAAVAAATRAHEAMVEQPLALRAKVIEAMRECTRKLAPELARGAVAETGLGRVDDKIQKNLLCANRTPGLEILEPWSRTGDDGLVLMERAPFGVIGSITPSTNPTETIINNAIGMVAGGNGVVFNVHPSAKDVSRGFVEALNQAIVAAGGPEGLVACLAEPTIDSAQALMRHAGIRLIVVTGGPAVVKAALGSGKRAIAAGPGNPPVVVDETAHLEQAGRDIVRGGSLDNNVVCIVEKEIFAVDSIATELKAAMQKHGAVEVKGPQIARLEKLVVTPDGHPVRDWVGKDAAKIARAAGIACPDEARLLVAEVDEGHPFIQVELLMPVMGLTRVRDVEEGIAAAVRAEHGFGHTAVMHSTNLDALHAMARAIDTSIFVKNGPSFAGLGMGGEGYTSFTIASPTGEGLTTAISFTRERRCTLKGYFRIV
ncbi:MAG: aldehyde dehydrogenase family protein [Deltaproteobacteria bacterium]